MCVSVAGKPKVSKLCGEYFAFIILRKVKNLTKCSSSRAFKILDYLLEKLGLKGKHFDFVAKPLQYLQ